MVGVAGVFGGPARAGEPGVGGRVTSNYEAFWGVRAARDCGYSEPIPGVEGESLWLFCDTTLLDQAGVQRGFIVGSTAARGPTRAGITPTALNEVPTPPQPLVGMPHRLGPALFLPLPTGLTRRDGKPCAQGGGSYPASWSGGMARVPDTGRILLTFGDVCLEGPWKFTAERLGLVEYDPASNRLTPPVTLWSTPKPGTALANKLVFGSPVFDGGYMYLFSSECLQQYVACDRGGIYTARVPVARRADPAAYQVWQGLGWGPQRDRAVNVAVGARPLGIHVDDFRAVGQGIVLVETTSIAGDYRVWQADEPAGPWVLRSGDRVIERCKRGPDAGMCYALIGQPELSTPQALALTYFGAKPQEISVTTTPW